METGGRWASGIFIACSINFIDALISTYKLSLHADECLAETLH
jgi:hypothetical protein